MMAFSKISGNSQCIVQAVCFAYGSPFFSYKFGLLIQQKCLDIIFVTYSIQKKVSRTENDDE